MKFIAKAVGAALVGFAAKKVIDSIENGTAQKSILDRFGRPLRDAHLGFNNTAFKLGIISERKKAELNKNVVEKYNAVRAVPNSNPIPANGSGNPSDISAPHSQGEVHSKSKASQTRIPPKTM
ncbi:hypothetical protein [Cyclobacterium qasimii]|uniref:Uncharacterized protein n=2 Tax=Cyclobacterium qasimii TaxID=1350429 RepID=S7WLK9_9BACT|nr:hypothetical protein [Cyclobacterium qasimii]EPR67624.1 hypothetical protein ADICYQ_3412 [Cyclobacterium qasimii M12-11B]GEO20889.1 hypothetical protein CQA01_14230 [Cyclobacterium qasimii]